MLGYMYAQRNDFHKAIDHFNAAIELNPHKIEFYNHRGNAFFEIGDYKHALEDDDKALELKNDQAETYVNRSMANYYLGNHPAALNDLKQGMKYGATNISEKFNTDLFTALQKDSIQIFTKMLEKDSLNAGIYNDRGIAKMQLKQYASAYEDFDKALFLRPSSNEIRMNRQVALANMNNRK